MVWLIANNKGGTGKTAIAVNMTFLLRQEGAKVLFIDCDFGQWNGAKWLNLENGVVCLKKQDLNSFEFDQKDYELVIVDTPAKIEGFRPEFEIIMSKSTHLLMPVDGANAIVPGAKTTAELWREIHKSLNNTAIVLNKQKHMSRLSPLLRKEVMDFVPGVPVLGVAISEGQVNWEMALRKHLPVWRLGPKYRVVFEVIIRELEALWHLS